MQEINKYINGTLEPSEFESFSKQLIIYQLDKEKRLRWEQLLKEKYAVEKTKRINLWQKNKILILSIAASLLIPILIYKNAFSPSLDLNHSVSQEIAQLNIMSNQVAMRKGLHSIDKLRQEAAIAYAEKDYKHVINLYGVSSSKMLNVNDCFYLGISHLKTNDAQSAKKWFSLTKSKDNTAFVEELNWLMALTYLALDDKKNALIELKTIVDNNGYQVSRAKALLKEL